MLSLFSLQYTAPLFSQQVNFESGLPHIINYSKKQFKEGHDQNWSLVQDSLGLIYIGNHTGLLIFNGIEFDFLPSENTIYSLGKDGKGNIYYGSENDFGLLGTNKAGKITFISFKNLIPLGQHLFAQVWSIKSIGNKVLFATKEKIFVYENNTITVIKPAVGSGIHKCFHVKKNYFAREFDGGISYLKQNRLEFIEGTEIFADMMVDFIDEIGDKIIIGTRKNGFYEMAWNSGFNKCVVKKISFPVSKYFEEGELYDGIRLSNQNFCFATKNAGIFIADQQGNLLEHYTKKRGLLDDQIWYVMEDNSKNLWAASSKGISTIDYLTPIRSYNSLQGLSGQINNVNIIENTLWINTNFGLFKGQKSDKGLGFIPYQEINTATFSINEFNNNSFKDLIVSGASGLKVIRNNHTIDIEDGVKFFKALQYSKNKNILIASGENLITIYEFVNGNYKLINEFEHTSQFRSIIEDNDGNVWVSGDNKSLVKITSTNYQNFNFRTEHIKISGDLKTENFMFKNKDVLFICSVSGVYELRDSANTSTFIKSTRFPDDIQNNENYVFRGFIDIKQNYWFAYDNNTITGIVGEYKRVFDTKYEFNGLFLNKYKNIQKNGFCEDSIGNLWIATNEGLLKYNTNEEVFYQNNFPVFIKQIKLKNDSIYSLIRGNIPAILTSPLPFSLNGVSFVISAANYSGVEDLQFASRLMPIEKEFSSWSVQNTKDYNYLPEGEYTMEVKSKDIFNNISDTKQLTFKIAPPWYRTKLAYIAYIILITLVIYLLIKYNTKRLRAINELLENTVKDRTKELGKERDKLREANHEITDSINYAQIIQNSILPSQEKFKNTFNDSFIYFKPRNIVSGDFYWFNLLDKKSNGASQHIIVAADSTGHGVPGAFMSMIGSEKLNQSIAEISDISPSKILSFMNRQIKDSLKQEEGNSMSKDGMEICLSFINKETNTLTYAGANRPLWIFRKDSTLETVEIIKPTKAGIAGHTTLDQVFEETTIQLAKGDTIYMFTDGAPDQFGGDKNKKLTTKGFRQLLMDIQPLHLEAQYHAISKFYIDWMGINEQVDDILIIGIRV